MTAIAVLVVVYVALVIYVHHKSTAHLQSTNQQPKKEQHSDTR